MSALRSILVHLDPSARSGRRQLLAQQLAALHDAHVTALYASTPAALRLSFAFAEGAAELVPMLQQLDIDYRDGAKALFDRSVSGAVTPVSWQELAAEPVVTGFAQRALCSDLLVLGQHDPADPMTAGVPADFNASVLLASGKPGLIVPYLDIGSTFGEQVLLAWKPTREAARAVEASMPLLGRAKQIHVTAGRDHDNDDAQLRALEAYLRLHGVRAPIERRGELGSDAAGEGLLSLAADVGADLLVMGCYGHTRAREWVLGGASRTVLGSMTLPVLMAH